MNKIYKTKSGGPPTAADIYQALKSAPSPKKQITMSNNTVNDNRQQFEKELAALINKYSLENTSNTPDFLLAKYLTYCLSVFEATSLGREEWYGKSLSINPQP